jgi:hypothetical protein
MRQSGIGIIHTPDDIDGIADSLRLLILDQATLSTKYIPDATYIQQFDFKVLTQQLARVFDEL